MEPSDIWILIGIGAMVLTVGIAWGTLSKQVAALDKHFESITDWMKSLQTQTDTNTTDIAVLAALDKERSERDAS